MRSQVETGKEAAFRRQESQRFCLIFSDLSSFFLFFLDISGFPP
jgi:hypothetical protein